MLSDESWKLQKHLTSLSNFSQVHVKSITLRLCTEYYKLTFPPIFCHSGPYDVSLQFRLVTLDVGGAVDRFPLWCTAVHKPSEMPYLAACAWVVCCLQCVRAFLCCVASHSIHFSVSTCITSVCSTSSTCLPSSPTSRTFTHKLTSFLFLLWLLQLRSAVTKFGVSVEGVLSKHGSKIIRKNCIWRVMHVIN